MKALRAAFIFPYPAHHRQGSVPPINATLAHQGALRGLYGMVWYGMAGVERLASIMRNCGTPGCELNSCMRCGDLGLAPSQMVSSLFRPSCALDEVDNRFVTGNHWHNTSELLVKVKVKVKVKVIIGYWLLVCAHLQSPSAKITRVKWRNRYEFLPKSVTT